MSGEGILAGSIVPMDETPPLITFTEAEGIGGDLFDRVEAMLGEGKAPMTRDDMGWGDLVQFVLRRASETVRDRENAV